MSYKGKPKSRVVGPEEGYDLHAPDYDLHEKFLGTFEQDLFYHLLGDLKGKKVLDIGCGTGRLIGYLKMQGAEVVAADLSEGMLEKLRKKHRGVHTVKADIEDLPFENESFDLVVCTFVIVHLKALQKAFDEVNRVLKTGGYFVVTNINQRKAPKIKVQNGEEIVIDSYYHIPKHVVEALEESFFELEEEHFVEERGSWVNQMLKGRKL